MYLRVISCGARVRGDEVVEAVITHQFNRFRVGPAEALTRAVRAARIKSRSVAKLFIELTPKRVPLKPPRVGPVLWIGWPFSFPQFIRAKGKHRTEMILRELKAAIIHYCPTAGMDAAIVQKTLETVTLDTVGERQLFRQKFQSRNKHWRVRFFYEYGETQLRVFAEVKDSSTKKQELVHVHDYPAIEDGVRGILGSAKWISPNVLRLPTPSTVFYPLTDLVMPTRLSDAVHVRKKT